jgi:hypothetical protein
VNCLDLLVEQELLDYAEADIGQVGDPSSDLNEDFSTGDWLQVLSEAPYTEYYNGNLMDSSLHAMSNIEDMQDPASSVFDIHYDYLSSTPQVGEPAFGFPFNPLQTDGPVPNHFDNKCYLPGCMPISGNNVETFNTSRPNAQQPDQAPNRRDDTQNVDASSNFGSHFRQCPRTACDSSYSSSHELDRHMKSCHGSRNRISDSSYVVKPLLGCRSPLSRQIEFRLKKPCTMCRLSIIGVSSPFDSTFVCSFWTVCVLRCL